MFGLGWPEVVVVGIVLVLLFGAKKIPEMGGALGRTLRGFKDEVRGARAEEGESDRSDL